MAPGARPRTEPTWGGNRVQTWPLSSHGTVHSPAPRSKPQARKLRSQNKTGQAAESPAPANTWSGGGTSWHSHSARRVGGDTGSKTEPPAPGRGVASTAGARIRLSLKTWLAAGFSVTAHRELNPYSSKPTPWDPRTSPDPSLQSISVWSVLWFMETGLHQLSPVLGTNAWRLVKLFRIVLDVKEEVSNSSAVAWFCNTQGQRSNQKEIPVSLLWKTIN